ETSAIAYLQSDVALLDPLEASGINLGFVVTDVKIGSNVSTVGVGGNASCQAGVGVGESNSYVRDGGTARISNGAQDGCFLSRQLCCEKAQKQKNRKVK